MPRPMDPSRIFREQTKPHRTQRDHDTDQAVDPAGQVGGDTGHSSFVGDGPKAEKGDQRRYHPIHSGPTRRRTYRNKMRRYHRSGSESNASK